MAANEQGKGNATPLQPFFIAEPARPCLLDRGDD